MRIISAQNLIRVCMVCAVALIPSVGYSKFVKNQVSAFNSEQGYVSSGREFFRSDQVDSLGAQIGLDAMYDWQKRRFRLGLDGSALYSGNEETFYLNPRKLFMAADINLADSQLYFGRQIFTWSEHENVWSRGLWQPRFHWQKLNPERQGLFGVFVNSRVSSRLSTLLFWSPIFIPELGPDTEIKDGRFVSANPWFRPPQKEIDIFDRSMPIDYSLDKPSLDDVAFNPSLGIKTEIKGERLALAASYAYKPINQLYLVAPVHVQIGDNDEPSKVNVEVKPKVNYHHLATVGLQMFARKDLRLHTSLTKEEVEFKEIYSQDWFQQRSRRATIFDVSMHNSWQGGMQSYLAYTKVWGGDLPVEHEFVKGRYMFPRRYEYFEAIKVGVNSDSYSLFKRPVTWGTDFTYDWDQRGMILSAHGSVRLMSQFTVLLSADFLGLVDSKEPKEEHGFIQDYRSNDRVSAEVKYVF